VIVAVADTGPLIHLDEIGALDLLSVVDGLLIPPTVYEELKAGTVPPALSNIEYEVVEADVTELTVDLDPGETAALAVASER
jgi:predicted nucleic acid-binding protein